MECRRGYGESENRARATNDATGVGCENGTDRRFVFVVYAMTINSRSKGARFEREVAAWLRETFGVEARRGQQFAGGPDSPDVIGLAGIHIEAKHVERLNIENAMLQAERDAGNAVPVVIHKRNRTAAMLTVRLESLPELARLIDAIRGDDACAGKG